MNVEGSNTPTNKILIFDYIKKKKRQQSHLHDASPENLMERDKCTSRDIQYFVIKKCMFFLFHIFWIFLFLWPHFPLLNSASQSLKSASSHKNEIFIKAILWFTTLKTLTLIVSSASYYLINYVVVSTECIEKAKRVYMKTCFINIC